MSDTESSERRASSKSKLLDHLHNPAQLRLLLTVLVLLVGYVAVYRPLSDRIAATKRNLEEAQKRLSLARNVEQLRMQFGEVEKRLPKQSDSKEWVRYVLGGIRQFPLTLKSLNCAPPRKLGSYTAIVLRIELLGSFADLDRFLYWLESNERLFRADEVIISPAAHSTGSAVFMKLTVLGVMG